MNLSTLYIMSVSGQLGEPVSLISQNVGWSNFDEEEEEEEVPQLVLVLSLAKESNASVLLSFNMSSFLTSSSN